MNTSDSWQGSYYTHPTRGNRRSSPDRAPNRITTRTRRSHEKATTKSRESHDEVTTTSRSSLSVTVQVSLTIRLPRCNTMPQLCPTAPRALSISPFTLARLVATAALSVAAHAHAIQDVDDAGHFGFDGLEVVKIDPKAGPIASGDFDGDGRADLAAANNFKSRIELHIQKPGATPDDPIDAATSVNEVPPHWRFRRVEIPVSHQVTAIAPFDFDGDGDIDALDNLRFRQNLNKTIPAI